MSTPAKVIGTLEQLQHVEHMIAESGKAILFENHHPEQGKNLATMNFVKTYEFYPALAKVPKKLVTLSQAMDLLLADCFTVKFHYDYRANEFSVLYKISHYYQLCQYVPNWGYEIRKLRAVNEVNGLRDIKKQTA
jgi:hypothetical protein